MDREEVRKAAEIMLAFADGKEIQSSLKGKNKWLNWVNDYAPSFDWETVDYRIKPEPKYHPFKTQEECWTEMRKHSDFGWVSDGYYKSTISVKSNSIVITISSDEYSFTSAFQTLTFVDGTPFGIKEE